MENENTEAVAEEEHAPEEGTLGVEESSPTVEDRVTELTEENSDLKDQLLRKQAEFENFRKRMFREKEDAINYANSNLLQDLIAIVDDFERAIKSSESSRDFESFHSGIELIEKQFTGMLERKWGLARFDSEGDEFDPTKHEAIMMAEDDSPTQVVLEDFQKGYMLHDRVLRPAKVKVSIVKTQEKEAAVEDEAAAEEEPQETNPGGEK